MLLSESIAALRLGIWIRSHLESFAVELKCSRNASMRLAACETRLAASLVSRADNMVDNVLIILMNRNISNEESVASCALDI